jgi:S-formylglutathione hydrolase FrmB
MVLCLILTGCSSGSDTSKPPGSGYEARRVVSLDELAQVEADARREGGTSTGSTVTVAIPPTRSGFRARDALVYLPPIWFSAAAPQLPVLLLLPGEPGGPTDWTDDGEADTIAGAFAAMHAGVAPIIVMPDATGQEDADSECINSSRYGNAEIYLTVDVPAYVRATFRAATGPGTLAVAGASAGGTCSTTMALRDPDIFPTFASFSGYATPTYKNETVAESLPILYDGSEAAYLAHDPLSLLKSRTYPASGAWFEAGMGDHAPWAAARELADAARQAAMEDVCLRGIQGGHTWAVWRRSLTDALPWLSARLGLTPRPQPPSADCSP